MKTLDRLKLTKNTLVLLTSDNGPVGIDSFQDGAHETVRTKKAASLRAGGKYGAFQNGTRVPLIVHWPGRVKPGVSDALIGQVDFLASLAALTGQELEVGAGQDSFDLLPALLGESKEGREHLVEMAGVLSLRQGPWKMIPPGNLLKRSFDPDAGSGKKPRGLLYRVDNDPGETNNLAEIHPDKLKEMAERLETLRSTKSVR
jgi:arylsulfatase A-like enzyme